MTGTGIGFVGVDPGLRHPAIALVGADGEVLAGTVLTVGAALRGGARLTTIRRQLETLLQTPPWAQRKLLHAALEGPSLQSTHREYDLGEASGVLRQWLYEVTSREPWVVAPTQLKKFATGHGQAEKETIYQEFVLRRLGFVTDSLDVSDAVVLARMAWQEVSGVRPLTRVQAEMIKALERPVKARRARDAKPPNV